VRIVARAFPALVAGASLLGHGGRRAHFARRAAIPAPMVVVAQDRRWTGHQSTGTDVVVLVVSGEVAADRVGDVVGVDPEDVDGDAGDFRFAGVLGLLPEAFQSLAVFAGEPFDYAHRRLLGG
jgi:hypothetical protein